MSLARLAPAPMPAYVPEPVTPVPIDATVLPNFWAAAEPMIGAALPYARNRWTVAGIRTDLETGDKRLWGVFRGTELICAIVTVNTDFPAIKVCTILVCGGADVDSWVTAALDHIEAAAEADGCAEVEIIGRPGWRRKCAGYDYAGVWLVKTLRQPPLRGDHHNERPFTNVGRETIDVRSL